MTSSSEPGRRRFLGALGAALAAPSLAQTIDPSKPAMTDTETPDLILHNGRFTTLDRANPTASAVAIRDGRFTAVGRDARRAARWPARHPQSSTSRAAACCPA